MTSVPELRDHPGLLAQLERARSLGFLGPGPVAQHIEHSGTFIAVLEHVTGTVVDLGSGGGVPGLVVAQARPDLSVVLLEATAKRCRFLESALGALGLDSEVVEARVELVGRSERRGTVDAVLARSFGSPAATAECAAPLLKLGGLLAVSEPPDHTSDRWPAEALGQLGLEVGPRRALPAAVQVLIQARVCPAEYPRRDGVPASRPLF